MPAPGKSRSIVRESTVALKVKRRKEERQVLFEQASNETRSKKRLKALFLKKKKGTSVRVFLVRGLLIEYLVKVKQVGRSEKEWTDG